MVFDSSEFLILLVCLYPLWWAFRKNHKASTALLLAGSAVFYGSNDAVLLLYLSAYCLLGWNAGLRISRSRKRNEAGKARHWAIAGISCSILGLGAFKYTPMVLNTFAGLVTGELSDVFQQTAGGWLVPLGISFFSFTLIAYIVDVYRGKSDAENSLLRFSLYLSFFPKLLSGPIVRPAEFLDQLKDDQMPQRVEYPVEALHLVARGFFKKAVLADRIAILISPFFLHVSSASTEGVWSLPYLYLYSLQIYLDFSAYTDIARGLGLLFGFRWPQNFNLPYAASNVREFWQRWHMTLSRFLRDYLYISLGGNRRGMLRTFANVFVTMLLGGLWHGASWSFAVWGGMHGLYLIVYRIWAGSMGKHTENIKGATGMVWRWVMIFLTFNAVSLAWAFFRITDVGDAFVCIKKVFIFNETGLLQIINGDASIWSAMFFYAFISYLISCWLKTVSSDDNPPEVCAGGFKGGFAIGMGVSLLLLSWLLSPGETAPFIYFQF